MSDPGRTPRPVEILLVEDNPGDIDLTLEALEEARVSNTVEVVEDGVEALRYLRQEGPYTDASPPDLVLLDLNLPRKDGREVLEEIKADPSLRRIPVVVLTTSDSEKDVLESYERHAAAYIVKPVNFDQFANVIRSIEGFWLTVVQYAQE
ncbi:MAG: response regulator [Longimicrobiales bacterium]|nr:response regulator [Longimicrobiales bacterium]